MWITRSKKVIREKQNDNASFGIDRTTAAPRLETWRKWRGDVLASPMEAFGGDRRRETLWKIFLWLEAFANTDNVFDSLFQSGATGYLRANEDEVPGNSERFITNRDMSSQSHYTVWNREALTHVFGAKVTNLTASAFQALWRKMPAVIWSERGEDEKDAPTTGMAVRTSGPRY